MRCPIIVGREEPVSVLADAVRRLRADARGGVLVVGEAGVGKTRLAEHTQEIAVRAGITTVIGRALPEAGGSPLRPFAEVLLELTRDRPAPVEDDLAPYAVVLGYPVFSALTMRLAAEAAIRDGWGDPGTLLRQADTIVTRLRLGRAAAACRTLLKTAGHTAPRRRAADARLAPHPTCSAGCQPPSACSSPGHSRADGPSTGPSRFRR